MQFIVMVFGIYVSGAIIKNNNNLQLSNTDSVFLGFFCDKNKNYLKDDGENFIEVYWNIYESIEIDLDYVDDQGYFNGIDWVEANISLNETNRHRAFLAHFPLRHAWFSRFEGENAFYFNLEDSNMYEVPLTHPGGRIKDFNYFSCKQFFLYVLSEKLLWYFCFYKK